MLMTAMSAFSIASVCAAVASLEPVDTMAPEENRAPAGRDRSVKAREYYARITSIAIGMTGGALCESA